MQIYNILHLITLLYVTLVRVRHTGLAMTYRWMNNQYNNNNQRVCAYFVYNLTDRLYESIRCHSFAVINSIVVRNFVVYESVWCRTVKSFILSLATKINAVAATHDVHETRHTGYNNCNNNLSRESPTSISALTTSKIRNK
jgi:hypothetical protein